MFFKGFKLGMVLQLAIGPVCLFIFETAMQTGFLNGCSGMLAVALTDALFIFLAASGITAFWENRQHQHFLKWFGVAVLLFFGITSLFEVSTGHSLISFSHGSKINVTSPFLRGLLLTASNPLTILFWSGLFAAKIAEEKLRSAALFQFGGGAVAATICFLTVVSGCGSIAPHFLPDNIIKYLNLAVGVFFIFFALKLGFKRKKN